MNLQDAFTLEWWPKIKCDNCDRLMNRRIEDKLHDANGKVRWIRWCGRARCQAAKRHWLAERNGKMEAAEKVRRRKLNAALKEARRDERAVSHLPLSANPEPIPPVSYDVFERSDGTVEVVRPHSQPSETISLESETTGKCPPWPSRWERDKRDRKLLAPHSNL